MNKDVKQWIFGSAILGGVALLTDMLLLEYLFFDVKRFRIGKETRNGQPHIDILHLSDLHFSHRVSRKYRKLAHRINALKPDIIFISGDSVDKDGDLRPLEKFLRMLKYSTPKVAVLGNHEYLSDIDKEQLESMYRRVNCDLLVNRSKAYKIKGRRLMVTGLDDMLEGNENFKNAVQDVGYEDNHMVLIHSPLHQEKIREQIEELNNLRSPDSQLNIYAIFAGHNHGGQVRIGGFVPHLPPKSGDYIQGWYNDEKPYLYLSKGFGSSKIPVRLGARSEIALFEYN